MAVRRADHPRAPPAVATTFRETPPASVMALRPAQKVDKDRRQQALFLLPILKRDILVGPVLGQYLVVFAVRHQPVRDLGWYSRMHPVVAGNDASRHLYRVQFGRAQPDDRMFAPSLKLRRHRSITATKLLASIAVSRARLAGLALISSLKCSLPHTASMPPACAISINWV